MLRLYPDLAAALTGAPQAGERPDGASDGLLHSFPAGPAGWRPTCAEASRLWKRWTRFL